MDRWSGPRWELSLDEHLADEMMAFVTRSAGTDRGGLKALMREIAARLPAERIAAFRRRSASPEACGCRPSAA